MCSLLCFAMKLKGRKKFTGNLRDYHWYRNAPSDEL
jgi:phage terminase large subunit-like protein